MKRIDTVNARENMFGAGKSGFHDNADLPGQDATYVDPEWFNTVQEELCNLLELRGIALDPASKCQLYDLLTTQVDLEALADAIETNFVRKNQIVDNLTTNDATKPLSAKQGKMLNDNKIDKSEFENSLVESGYQRLPNGYIEQWGKIAISTMDTALDFTFPFSFPDSALNGSLTNENSANNHTADGLPSIISFSKTGFKIRVMANASGQTVPSAVYYRFIGK